MTAPVRGPNGDPRLSSLINRHDGEYHIPGVDLSDQDYRKGSIRRIRFDFFDGRAEGGVMCVKSVVPE